jgi:hypothetical protein
VEGVSVILDSAFLEALPEGIATLWHKASDYTIFELELLFRMGQQCRLSR